MYQAVKETRRLICRKIKTRSHFIIFEIWWKYKKHLLLNKTEVTSKVLIKSNVELTLLISAYTQTLKK
jgi:hypothetical protein